MESKIHTIEKYIKNFYKKFHVSRFMFHDKGSVLIMAIVITSSIVIIGVELSTFIGNALRAARTSDRALAAQYAAESALESGVHQIRKEALSVLRKSDGNVLQSSLGASAWSYRDGDFSQSIPRFEKALIPKETATQFDLYQTTETGIAAIEGIKELRIAWENASSCLAENQPPGIEVSFLAWKSGASLDWSSSNIQKVFLQDESAETKTASIDLSALNDPVNTASLATEPLVVRIKPYFCDLSDVSISLPSATDPTQTIAIPNYYLLRPHGVTGTIEQQGSAIVPRSGSLSDIFDFALFSEDQVTKTQ